MTYRAVLALVFVACLGQASAQTPPQVDGIPVPPPTAPVPPAPLASDVAILQGTWQVTLTDVESSKHARWTFGDSSVTVKEGAATSMLPFQLVQKGPEKLIVFQLPGQKWSGRYTLVDNDTVLVRLRRPGAETAPFSMFVLLRESAKK